MRFLLTGMSTILAQRLRSFRGWLALLLIPALVLSLNRALPVEELTAPVQVGVCLPQTGAEAFWDLLKQRSGTVLSFVPATEAEIEARVAAGHWDCGLVLPEDFAARLERLELDGLFTLRTGPGSGVYPLVRETVSACVAQLVSPDMAWEYLVESGLAEGIADPGAARERLSRVLDASDRVLVTMTAAGGEPLAPLALADSGIRQLLCWLVSCLMLIWLLLGASELEQWMESPGTARMAPLRGKTCRMLLHMGPEALLVALSGSLTLALLGFGPGAWLSVWAYALLWMSAAVLLGRFRAPAGALPAVMPFGAALSLLSSGLLAQPPEPLRWMPVRLFLAGCAGDLGACLALAGCAAVLLGAGFALDRRKG